MKNCRIVKHILFIIILTLPLLLFAQKKPGNKKTTSQTDMNKMLENAMKQEGMSKEEQAEMKGMMKDFLPELSKQNAATANYPEFTTNRSLVPKSNATKLAIAKKNIGRAASGYAIQLYNKLIAKAKPNEVALIKKIIAQSPKAVDLSNSAVVAMLQGHAKAAMALALKALSTQPGNLNWQNNAAAILTNYGFPEYAMPLLQDMERQQPKNSTVLTNIAYAWLGLGEIEKERQYSNMAIAINSRQPEAQLCGGFTSEVIGDPIKANEQYTNAQSLAPNPFTQQVRNNSKSTAPLSWDKIRCNINIYEYYLKGWIKMPGIVDDVTAYNENIAWKKAFEKMMEAFEKNIEALTEKFEKDMDDLADKGDNAFVKEMAGAALKGQSWMSKPATEVLKVLHAYEMQRQLAYTDSVTKLTFQKEQLKKRRDKAISALYKSTSDCKKIKKKLNEIENTYMRQVNGTMRNFLNDYVEQQRMFFNAWVTWSWYVAGNPNNIILTQSVQQAEWLASAYKQVVAMMEMMPEHCDFKKQQEIVKTIAVPDIPNFTCPAVVSIPGGKEWQQLRNDASNFDANAAMKKTTEAIPNMLVSYGMGNLIAQAGISPSLKTGNGSVATLNGSEELADLPRITPDDLAPLPKLTGEDLAPLPDLRKAKLAKDLMQKMMNADCSKVRNSKDILKEQLDKMIKQVEEMENEADLKETIKTLGDERIKELTNNAIEAYIRYINDKDPTHLTGNLDSFKTIIDKISKYYPQAIKDIEAGMSTYDTFGPQLSLKQDVATAISTVKALQEKLMSHKMDGALLKDVQQNGLTPTISSSLQSPGVFVFLKGIFN